MRLLDHKRMNVARSDSTLWLQVSSADNTDPLVVVPVSSSNVAGAACNFTARNCGAQESAMSGRAHTIPDVSRTRGRTTASLADVTITPVRWLTIGNDATMILQRSWQPRFRRSSVGSGIRRFWTNGRQTGIDLAATSIGHQTSYEILKLVLGKSQRLSVSAQISGN